MGMGNSCTVLQEGTYTVSGTQVNTEFVIDDDDCVIEGDQSYGCSCVEPALGAFTVTSADCQTMTGPNGETCTATATCDDNFSCPSGQQPQADPNYTADFNGCGPSDFPITGPSFGFEDCCIGHDICYGTCGTNKIECDNDFYACMYCKCEEENFIERQFCQEIACTYYELVDEFGCFAFNGGQDDACICPGSKDAEHKSYTAMESAPSKFGSGSIKETELFCNGPFEPDTDTCASYSTTSPSRTKAAAVTASRTPASGSSASRTPSRSRTRNNNNNDDNDITVTNPITVTNIVDDNDSSASTLVFAAIALFAIVLVL